MGYIDSLPKKIGILNQITDIHDNVRLIDGVIIGENFVLRRQQPHVRHLPETAQLPDTIARFNELLDRIEVHGFIKKS